MTSSSVSPIASRSSTCSGDVVIVTLSEAERAATIRRGVETMNAIYDSTVPWATVIVRKAYGVAGAAMSDHTRFQYRFAWPSGDWGSLPIEGGVQAAYRRDIEAADDPAAYRAFVGVLSERQPIELRDLFETKPLGEAVSLNSVGMGLMGILSATVAGYLIQVAGAAGAVPIPLLDSLLGGEPLSDLEATVLWEIRLPRVLLAAFVGAALAVELANTRGIKVQVMMPYADRLGRLGHQREPAHVAAQREPRVAAHVLDDRGQRPRHGQDTGGGPRLAPGG